MIVEDSVDLQDLLAQLFTSEGYKYTQVYDGQEALEVLRAMTKDLPTLILLDIMMPEMDGIEVRRALAADPTFAKIPVIVMTADTNAESKVKELGIADVIRKPISDIRRIVESVEQHSAR